MIHKTTRVDRSHHECGDVPVTVEIARFRGRSGVEEIHLIARPTEYGSFGMHLNWVGRGCQSALEAMGIDGGSAILRRFFCSDLSNQRGELNACAFSSPGDDGDACAVSRVGQPPAGPAKVALWAYHIFDPSGEVDKRREGDTLTLRRGQLCHHWTSGLTSPGKDSAFDQTRNIFATYEAFLRGHGLSLSGNLIRTWLYVRDIDADYGELLEARREFFAQRGLTPQTHYVASTGVGGSCATPATRVTLDAYAISGVQLEQIEYIKALDYLCSADLYGATFERATAVTYRDRTHVLISGTASINQRGDVLHPADVSRQLGQTLTNVEALLTRAGAGCEDTCMLIAYLRDLSDEPVVRRRIRDRFGDVPLLVVAARICRPAWLVEVEAQAIIPASRAELPPF